jgi:hypothetical protein
MMPSTAGPIRVSGGIGLSGNRVDGALDLSELEAVAGFGTCLNIKKWNNKILSLRSRWQVLDVLI